MTDWARARAVARRLLPVRFARREDGTATIEFVIIFPLFFIFLCMSIDTGIMMVRQVMLERGLDIAVRELRINTGVPVTADDVVDTVCENALVIQSCEQLLRVELRPINTTTWAPLNQATTCALRTEPVTVQPMAQFTPGTRNEMMLVRACAVFETLFPGLPALLGTQTDGLGGYFLVATSAFVHEPPRAAGT